MLPPSEVVVVGGRDAATRALIRVAHESFDGARLILGRLDNGPVPDAPALRDRPRVDGRPTAYACRAYACRLPVTDPDALRAELRASG
jgi:hypothetical protein